MNAFFTGLTAPLQPYLFAIKCVILVAVITFVGWKVWELRGDLAEHELQTAVNDQIAHDAGVIKLERENRQIAEAKADSQLQSFMDSLKDLRIKVAAVNAGIAKERTSNPKFYDQPLPEGGYTQWMTSRNLVTDTPTPASGPASTPSAPTPSSGAASSPSWSSLFLHH